MPNFVRSSKVILDAKVALPLSDREAKKPSASGVRLLFVYDSADFVMVLPVEVVVVPIIADVDAAYASGISAANVSAATNMRRLATATGIEEALCCLLHSTC
jgi:hypothetical protein